MAIKFKTRDGTYLPEVDSSIYLLKEGFLKATEFDVTKYYIATVSDIITDKLVFSIYIDTLNTLKSVVESYNNPKYKVLLWMSPYSLDYLKPEYEEGD